MNTKSILKLILTLAFILAALLFLYIKKEEFLLLKWPSYFAISAICLAFTINLYFNSLFNMLVSRQLGVPLSGRESFMLSSVTSAVNFTLPLRAGAAFRAMYMKKVYKFPFSHFASSIAIYYLGTILVASFAGMLCLIIIYFYQGYFRIDLFILFPVILFIVGISLIARSGKEIVTGTSQMWWSSFLSGYRSIISNNRIVYIALLIISAGLLVSTLAWAVALREYAPQIGFVESFLIVVSQIIGGLVPLTPGGTGFQELGGIYVGHKFNITLVELFAVLVWTKVARIIVSVLLAFPSIVFLKRRINASA
jgi:uncharacterized membrane protein YbhN (UPF0104 family)